MKSSAKTFAAGQSGRSLAPPSNKSQVRSTASAPTHPSLTHIPNTAQHLHAKHQTQTRDAPQTIRDATQTIRNGTASVQELSSY
eukprot:1951830-Prymnesium_polylepis.1